VPPRPPGSALFPYTTLFRSERGGRAEQQDPEDQDPLAAVDVRELAVYRERDGGSQRVSGECPRIELEAFEFGDDPRQGGTDDREVQGRQEQDDEDAAEGQ